MDCAEAGINLVQELAKPTTHVMLSTVASLMGPAQLRLLGAGAAAKLKPSAASLARVILNFTSLAAGTVGCTCNALIAAIPESCLVLAKAGRPLVAFLGLPLTEPTRAELS